MEIELLEKIAKMMMSSDEEMSILGSDIFFKQDPTQEDVDIMNKIFPPLTPGSPHFYIATKRSHIESFYEMDVETLKSSIEKKQVDIFEGMKIKK